LRWHIDSPSSRALVSQTMKVLFDINNGRIGIEGDGPDLIAILQLAREIAPSLSKIELITSAKSEGNLEGRSDNAEEKTPEEKRALIRGGVPTLREFVKKVAPTNTPERIISIGVYQSRYHKVESFSPKEMADWFTHAGLQKPTQMPVALHAAKQRYGYVESPGHGRWKVTTAGENAVTRKLESGGE
jgi:hypothetical protein